MIKFLSISIRTSAVSRLAASAKLPEMGKYMKVAFEPPFPKTHALACKMMIVGQCTHL